MGVFFYEVFFLEEVENDGKIVLASLFLFWWLPIIVLVREEEDKRWSESEFS